MSPPIRDGSGSSIGSIRLGDGTEISEVRTGAGDVLFSAAPTVSTVVDSFEDGNISEYGGGTGAYSVISSDATDGSNALKLDNPTTGGSGSFDGMASTSGLIGYPSRGDIFRCDWKPTQDLVGSGNRVTVAFGTQGQTHSSGCYAVSLDFRNSVFGLGESSLSASPNLISEPLGSVSTGTQYFVEVEWGSTTNNDNIVARLVEKSSGTVINDVTVSNSLHDSGGIGFGVNQKSGTPQCIYDFFRVIGENAV